MLQKIESGDILFIFDLSFPYSFYHICLLKCVRFFILHRHTFQCIDYIPSHVFSLNFHVYICVCMCACVYVYIYICDHEVLQIQPVCVFSKWTVDRYLYLISVLNSSSSYLCLVLTVQEGGQVTSNTDIFLCHCF